MHLFYLGLVFWTFAILWVYPLFQEQNIGMGAIFAVIAFCFYFLFTLISEPKKDEESLIFRFLKSIYLSLLAVTLQVIGLWLYIELFSRWRELNFLTPVFKVILRLFSIPVVVSQG